MLDYISDRVIKEGKHIIETNSTVRGCALYFSISKSTVHKDVTLPNVLCGLFNKTIKTRQNQVFCFVFFFMNRFVTHMWL